MDSLKQGPVAAALAANAVSATTTEDFVRAAGQILWDTRLRVERIFVSLHTLHPAYRARTYLWRKSTDHVESVEWPHGLKNRPGYYDSPDFRVHRSRKSSGFGIRKELRNLGAILTWSSRRNVTPIT